MIQDIKLITETAKGTLIKVPAAIEYDKGRIWFHKSPFALKDEIKAMRGSRWHANDDENPRKMWSVDDCHRNRFQLRYMMGENVYEWFDQPLKHYDYETHLKGIPTPMMEHQRDLADHGLTYHFQIWGAEMGVGKTLAAQQVIVKSGKKLWYWVGPKSSIPNIIREFKWWGFPFDDIHVEFMTYERLKKVMDEWTPGDPVPDGVIFDESSRLKTWTSQRTQAADQLAALIRETHGFEGFVIEMSGTPSPKRPTDWWAQCEVAYPGFLKEGSVKALEQRLGFVIKQEMDSGSFWKTIGWKDDEKKCAVCGSYFENGPHELEYCEDPNDFHEYVASKNEVAFMHERLKGLVVIKHKKDCLQLPEKRYRTIICKPTASVLRVAKVIAEAASNTITGMTLLREFSDGFQYREVADGLTKCNHCPDACGAVEEWFNPEDNDRIYGALDFLDEALIAKLQKRTVTCPRCHGKGQIPKMKRITKEIPCPKDAAVKELLDENEETGRIVIFGGFTGSVDRVTNLCRKEGWHVVRCDGRGFQVTDNEGNVITSVQPLDYWSDLENNLRVAFVAHPESGGMSLTLTESRMAVYYSNSFKPEYRTQSEDRIHRKGMDENLGCTIVDLIHLPSDERALEIIRENRRLELMTMGEVLGGINWESSEEGALEVAA